MAVLAEIVHGVESGAITPMEGYQQISVVAVNLNAFDLPTQYLDIMDKMGLSDQIVAEAAAKSVEPNAETPTAPEAAPVVEVPAAPADGCAESNCACVDPKSACSDCPPVEPQPAEDVVPAELGVAEVVPSPEQEEVVKVTPELAEALVDNAEKKNDTI